MTHLTSPVQSVVLAEREANPIRLSDATHGMPSENTPAGGVFLATTYLPPATHSRAAVLRYADKFGGVPQSLRHVEDKVARTFDVCLRDLQQFPRIDVVDRVELTEYFRAPEYFQMPLTREELHEQVANVIRLLEHTNYELCLTPAAVNLPFELRRGRVSIRSDRRNKGEPRVGEVNHLILRDPATIEAFEQDFWFHYRATEPEFRSKRYVADWLRSRADEYRGPAAKLERTRSYDVFLCYHSPDRKSVMELGERLLERRIAVWLDRWCLRPGTPWIRALEQQISSVKAAAVVVGESGTGPWMQLEVELLLREFVRRGCPVIPVILSTASSQPQLPPFLEGFQWVDFRHGEQNPLEQLLWGITGQVPQRAAV